TPEEQAQVDLATGQIEILRDRLNGIITEVQDIDEQINALRTPVESTDETNNETADPSVATTNTPAENQALIESLTFRRNVLNTQDTEISTTIAQFSSQMGDVRQRVNRLTVVQPAVTADAEAARSQTVATVMGLVAGAVLSTSFILLI